MEPIARVARQPRLGRGHAARHVERIAHEGMAGRGQVDADLVRASGGDRHLHERPALPDGEHPHVGDGPLAVPAAA